MQKPFYNTLYTLEHKRVECPIWKTEVIVTARYNCPIGEGSNVFQFVGATCEILENIKLPESKKNKVLAPYRFCRIADECQCLRDFPKELDK